MKKSNNFSNVPKTLAPEEDEERNALIRKLDICKFEFFNFSLPPLPGTKDEIDVAVVHGPSAYRRNKFDAHIWVGLLNGEYRRYLYSIEYSKKEYNPENYVKWLWRFTKATLSMKRLQIIKTGFGDAVWIASAQTLNASHRETHFVDICFQKLH